ncbi:cobalamin B12-binding domain-containing protein [Bradyrhizobium manausense]|jgi:methylmalonyl-CoA mutase C-terminal domain/subunit|uniref:cobalamin B12-binding domain-containing protein n=1 Tax=Bradyrhizobium manausense TaxID=989370 RepID=UPI001BAB07CF|nr:cobalamin B12-binding domain-containing protein [Bradyrhizobium manausense]MBR1087650.1 cobalamin B12-binding domain-containing protein [Bradyrhizobium manausense]
MSNLKGKRILIAKPGLDGHDIGAKIIALALRDAGAEVIYTGLRKTPGFIARVAVDEDVDAVGLSLLSGSHKELVAETMQELRKLDAGDIPVFVGGTIPAVDRAELMDAGVMAIFTAEMRLDDVVAEVARALTPVQAA